MRDKQIDSFSGDTLGFSIVIGKGIRRRAEERMSWASFRVYGEEELGRTEPGRWAQGTRKMMLSPEPQQMA